MRIQTTSPTGQPQQFEVNETFFSTTDPRGVITAGNEVFARTSGYSLAELRGQSHNLIRHGDMPRCVFQLLWQSVRERGSFAGYVKNQAKNGNHYWVFALIVPLSSGFLSVRIKPTTPLLATIEPLYRTLLAIETAALGAGQNEAAASAASTAALAIAVEKLGFPSYEAFSHHALNAEIRSRDAEVARRGLRLFPATLAGGSAVDRAFHETGTAYERVNALYSSLDAFAAIAAQIQARHALVCNIAENFRIDALNVHIAAHPLGDEGVALGTVAQFLNGYARGLAADVAHLTGHIGATSASVAAITSNLSTARIQLEMLQSFLAEIAGGAKTVDVTELLAMAADLRCAFLAALDSGLAALAELQRAVPAVQAANELVRKDIIQLHVAQITGLTEVARLVASENLAAMFAGLRAKIEAAKSELETLAGIVDQLVTLTAATPPRVNALQAALAGLRISGGPDGNVTALFTPAGVLAAG